MEIYPALQLQMAVAALCAGAILGLWHALLPALRILVGAYRPPQTMRATYEKTLPLLHRAVGFPREGGMRRGWKAAVIAAEDLALCLVAGITVILLLYAFNSGAFRLSVPILLLLGMWLCHRLTARPLAAIIHRLAFGAAVLALYAQTVLLLPLRLLRRYLWQPLCTLWRIGRLRHLQAVSDRLCRCQLALASTGLMGGTPKEEKRKGRTQHGNKKRQRQDHTAGVGDPYSDPLHFRGVPRHRHRSLDQ